MFKAVRDWWRSARPRHSARLFVFEFAVVLAGVLAAQALADWAHERSALETMEHSRARTEAEIRADLHDALIWKAAAPCFRDRMHEVMVQAADGPIDAALEARPSIKTLYFTPISDETSLLMRRRYGDVHAHLLDMLRFNIDSLNNRAGRAATAWGRLALAASANGAVSVGDRLAAREAAAEILSELRGIAIVTDNVLKYGQELGLEPDGSEEPGFGPARSCAAIWKSGRSDPPVNMPQRNKSAKTP